MALFREFAEIEERRRSPLEERYLEERAAAWAKATPEERALALVLAEMFRPPPSIVSLVP